MATVEQTPPAARTRARRRRFTVDAPIHIGQCDSCRRDEQVLRRVRDVTELGNHAEFDLCRPCAPTRT